MSSATHTAVLLCTQADQEQTWSRHGQVHQPDDREHAQSHAVLVSAIANTLILNTASYCKWWNCLHVYLAAM